MKKKILDIIVVGTGIAGLNFIDKYLDKKKKINVISPLNNKVIKTHKRNRVIKVLPSQMRNKFLNVDSYYSANNLELKSNCKAIGSLSFGGLSNYWGLQIDSFLNNDQSNLNKKDFFRLKDCFLEFLKKNALIGETNINTKENYRNNFIIPKELDDLCQIKDNNFECKKPILAFTMKNFNGDLNILNEEKQKLTSNNLFKKIKNKKKIVLHNFYLDRIQKEKNIIKLFCKNKGKEKIFFAKKIVLATGTIATTKILIDFFRIKREVRIKHHPRLLSVFFSKIKFNYNLNFTPSLLQIKSRTDNDYFTADIRPGNKLITKSIIDAFPFLGPIKFIINIFRNRLIFSNILLDSKFSNLYMKKDSNKYILFSKNRNLSSILRIKNKKIFKFLLRRKIILPIFKTFFPGNGADYHYFGSIPFKNKGELAVNNKCQLRSCKNIYIVDGSTFDFRTNKYPLGIVAANARRIAKHLSS